MVKPTRRQFEYRTQIWEAIPLEGLLNVEGDLGWELVAAVSHNGAIGCFYRREKAIGKRKAKR